MSHYSKDAIVERAEQDAVEMSDKELIDLIIAKELADAHSASFQLLQRVGKITRGETSRDGLIDQAIDILVKYNMHESQY
tara:strand:+ start:982 stop:1221 length:240 start_codon:yes stop_codon:yes gene_type:complete